MSNITKRIDSLLLIPAFLLVAIGLSAQYSINTSFFNQQLIALGLGVLLYLLFATFPYQLFVHFAKFIYVGIIVALLIVLFVGDEIKGAVRWIDIFGVSLQVSEIVKPFFVISVAALLTYDEKRSLIKFIVTLISLSVPFFLILRQPDLGSGILYAALTGGMMFLYGFSYKYFIVSGAALIISFPFVFTLLHEYQRQRIVTFFDLTADPFGTSYNAIQSLISIGSGGIFGKGFGQSTQSILRFLPEQHTDFIFATVSENLGLIGGVLIMSLYIVLLYRIYKIGLKSKTEVGRIICNGFFLLLLFQAFFNIGMNIGLLPVVGITLPFVSYGGSSLVTNFVVLGIVSSIAGSDKSEKMLEIR